MNVLILGSGGREHALAWKLVQSPLLNKLFIVPGNAGTANVGKNIPIGVNDFEVIKEVVLQHQINLVIVGPEDPLVRGIHDFFSSDNDLKDVAVIGPKKEGAQLEGSKEFAKEFMVRHNIPTAKYQSFTAKTLEESFRFLETLSPPYVLKADGLAAGKGVLIINDLEEAKMEMKEMLTYQKFGSASNKVVIEEYLDGIEMSCFALTDGKEYVILPNAKDYKRIGEGDTGLNTGGMGAVSPVPFADKDMLNRIEKEVIKPTVKGLLKDNIDYVGFLFFGLMIVDNEPFVIEYNVRMGDPETEVVIPRLKSDLLELFIAVKENKLKEYDIELKLESATTIMAVSGGYPESYGKGKPITGLKNVTDSIVFHAGTKQRDERIVTDGGRVIAFTSFGKNYKEALKKSYESLKKVDFDKMYYRRDIGFDL